MKRFLDKVKVSPNGCHEWQASKDRQGYGYFSLGKLMHAHRAAYILFKGAIPEGMLVLHSCDNTSCVNPAHLSLGTHTRNQAEKAARGRSLRGERSPNAKLTADLARAIFQDLRPQEAIAAAFNVGQTTVARIKLGQSWSHATGCVPRQPGHFNGTRSYQAMLTEDQVRKIRTATGTTARLSRSLGLPYYVVDKARKGLTYRSVE